MTTEISYRYRAIMQEVLEEFEYRGSSWSYCPDSFLTYMTLRRIIQEFNLPHVNSIDIGDHDSRVIVYRRENGGIWSITDPQVTDLNNPQYTHFKEQGTFHRVVERGSLGDTALRAFVQAECNSKVEDLW